MLFWTLRYYNDKSEETSQWTDLVDKPTLDATYYHRVVDCQWACPAHTPVPEYIRLIAEGRYTDAYMVNRRSNVFPGILGRVCDRPCEPACRRGRVEEEPVAICRLKRVAADFRGDVAALLPKIPLKKNGKRVALIGAGPASLTVANDLMPLGYQVSLFEKERKGGGAIRSSVPLFRLPERVLDDEVNMILTMGVDAHFQKPVTSMAALLAAGYDAVFVGSGAPMGKDLLIPGRKEAGEDVQIGLTWLANVAFQHTASVSEHVLVIGGGNTAMDCCRTAKRIGGKNVSVVAPEAFEEMLASPWEKEETLEEGIPIRNHLLPKEFVIEGGRLKGVRFTHLKQCYDPGKKWNPIPSGEADVLLPCDTVILAIGQTTAFPFIERDIGLDFLPNQDRAKVDQKTFQSTHEKIFFGGDAAFGPKNIIWAVAHGHEAAISIDQFLRGKAVSERPAPGMTAISQKMGIHEWSYDNAYAYEDRVAVPHLPVAERFEDLRSEVELGYDVKLALEEAGRCLNCDVQTVFSDKLCIECDACVDICPVSCLTMTPDAPAEELLSRLSAPVLHYPDQAILLSAPLRDTGRLMVKDEDICLHCGLCAERCPTGAWDMQKVVLHLAKAGEA